MSKKLKNKDPFQVTHKGKVKIGEKELSCAVLQNGMRIITRQALFYAFDAIAGGKMTKTELPRLIEPQKFSQALAMLPFAELEKLKLIEFTTPSGKKKDGYQADVLPIICEVMLRTRELKVSLSRFQEERTRGAELLVRALSKVGITALVDEATGYEKQRKNRELAKFLNLYLTDEYAPWSKLFPDSYYEEMFRLNGWSNKNLTQKPQCIGHYTNDIIYSRLVPHVLSELKVFKEQNKYTKYHQYFTNDIGHPALSQHLHTVIALMKVSKDWGNFKFMIDQVLPRKEQSNIAA